MLYAVYGSLRSFYGSIGYGAAPLPIKNYGGWPDEHPDIQDDSLPEIDPVEQEIAAVKTQAHAIIADDIAENIAIIRRLKAELEAAEDTKQRQNIREQLEKARKEKVRQFQLRAIIDDEETAFILFH